MTVSEKEMYDSLFYIHVYLHTDLQFDKEAKKSFRFIKKHKEVFAPYIDEMSELEYKNLDELCKESEGKTFWRGFNKILKEIITRKTNWQTSYDTYGAFLFKNEKDDSFLVGDSYHMYALHDYESLLSYLSDND